jgi:hypothetical protein
VVEVQLGSGDLKASLAAAKYILQGTRLLGETDLPMGGPTTPEGSDYEGPATWCPAGAGCSKKVRLYRDLSLTPFRAEIEENFEDKVETLAMSRLQKAMAKAGLA